MFFLTCTTPRGLRASCGAVVNVVHSKFLQTFCVTPHLDLFQKTIEKLQLLPCGCTPLLTIINQWYREGSETPKKFNRNLLSSLTDGSLGGEIASPNTWCDDSHLKIDISKSSELVLDFYHLELNRLCCLYSLALSIKLILIEHKDATNWCFTQTQPDSAEDLYNPNSL